MPKGTNESSKKCDHLPMLPTLFECELFELIPISVLNITPNKYIIVSKCIKHARSLV